MVWADLSLDVNGVLGMRQDTLSVLETHIVNEGGHFLGLRFDIGGNDYGWMLLNTSVNDNSMTVIVKEYAYEATPNTSIIVGNTGETSSLEQNTNDEIMSLTLLMIFLILNRIIPNQLMR